jgi:galactose mutarotase-like enzyme
MSEQTTPWLKLGSSQLSAEVDPHGAQLSILRDADGRDLLWNGDAAVWAGRAPLLFPIVGALAGGEYRLGDRRYALARHGFARGLRFEVLRSEAQHALLRLGSGPATLDRYPFEFELDADYLVEGATLTVTATVRNTDAAPLPASFGYHPAFRWPLPYGAERGSHYVEFELDEPAPMRRLDGQGLVIAQQSPTPIAQRRLHLDDALFTEDVVIFDRVRSRSVSYGAPSGPRLEVRFPDSPYLGLWTKPGAGFICIEPWNGIADPQGFSGDFTAKPGVFMVAPGAQKSLRMAISLL